MMRVLNYNIEMVARAQTNAGSLTEADIRAVAACQNKAQAAAHVGDAAHRMSGLPDMHGLAGRMEPDGLQHQCPNEPEGVDKSRIPANDEGSGLGFLPVYTGWTQPMTSLGRHGQYEGDPVGAHHPDVAALPVVGIICLVYARFLPQNRVIWPRPSVRASSGALPHQNPICATYWLQ